MICYFSATGNSKRVAERIAEAIGEDAVSIEALDPAKVSGAKLSLVSPVYFWTMPVIVKEFLEKVDPKELGFLIITYGSTTGHFKLDAEAILKSEFQSSYEIRMPDTWTPEYDVSDQSSIKDQVAASEKSIDDLIASIKKGEKGNFITKTKSSLTRALSDKAFHLARATKNFHLADGCTGCGLCADRCPDKAIEIRDGKPEWVKDRCEICFRCLHHCPEFAIQYGNGKTEKHGQYTNPYTKI